MDTNRDNQRKEKQDQLLEELSSLRQKVAELEATVQIDVGSADPLSAPVIDLETAGTRETLEQIIEAVAEGVLVADDQGQIIHVNGRIELLFGYRDTELQGKSVEVLLPETKRVIHKNHFQEFLLNPRTRPMYKGRDLGGLRKDGSEIRLQIALGSVDSKEGRLVIAIMTEVLSFEQTRPESLSDDITLLSTKLYMPRISVETIMRSRLLERMNESLAAKEPPISGQTFLRKLTLVTAPAGYGKTTLAASWLKDLETPSAWISFDKDDNNLLVVFRYFSAAVNRLFPESITETAQLAFETRDVTPAYLAATLVNDLNAIAENFILVFDDFHLIHDRAVISLIAQLINNQPPNLHLVIISRTDPSLPIPRLRAAGEINEIRIPELRFRDEEAECFVRGEIGFSVDQKSIIALNQQTEGWIVGLRLALLSIRGQRDLVELIERVGSQPNTYVSDYLLSEVLAQQPEATRALMVRSSILKRMSGHLIEALMDRDETDFSGQAFLEWLVGSNLFVVPLDDQGHWFRYHHLFQAILEHHLQASHSEAEINALHLLASGWFSERGLIEEAIEHAQAGDDVGRAIELVEEQSHNLLNRPDRFELARWLAKLPQDIISQRPALMVSKAWLLYREWRLMALDEILDALEELSQKEPPHQQPDYFSGHLAALRSATAFMVHQDPVKTRSQTNRALELLPLSEPGARATAIGFQSLAQQALGDGSKAIRSLERNIRRASQAGQVTIQYFIALVLLHQTAGDLEQMSRVVQQFLELASTERHPNAVSAANRFSGWLNYEWNDLNTSQRRFKNAAKMRFRSNFVAFFDSAMSLARIELVNGKVQEAELLLDDLRAETLHLKHMVLMGPLEAFEAHVKSLSGDHYAALRWARAVDSESLLDFLMLSDDVGLTRARILLTHGSKEETLAVEESLASQLDLAKSQHHTLRQIRILVHQALAYKRLGDRQQALLKAEDAVRLAQPGGFIRTFLDLGEPLRELISLLGSRMPDEYQPYLEKLQSSFDLEDASSSPFFAQGQEERVAITRRELDVLRLMKAEKSDAEIAEELVIALSTARKHASNIYRKLDANNRWQAIQKAEELGIL